MSSGLPGIHLTDAPVGWFNGNGSTVYIQRGAGFGPTSAATHATEGCIVFREAGGLIPSSIPSPAPAYNVTILQTFALTDADHSISGTIVRDQGRIGRHPLANATVDLIQSGSVVMTTSTDALGHYFFIGAALGTYSVAPRKSGLHLRGQLDAIAPLPWLAADFSLSGIVNTKGTNSNGQACPPDCYGVDFLAR